MNPWNLKKSLYSTSASSNITITQRLCKIPRRGGYRHLVHYMKYIYQKSSYFNCSSLLSLASAAESNNRPAHSIYQSTARKCSFLLNLWSVYVLLNPKRKFVCYSIHISWSNLAKMPFCLIDLLSYCTQLCVPLYFWVILISKTESTAVIFFNLHIPSSKMPELSHHVMDLKH
jgi:hypothetical protein